MPVDVMPEHVLDLTNAENWANIKNAIYNKAFYVMVVAEDGLSGKVKYGIAKRSEDGESFSVDVQEGRETETYTWSWNTLIASIHSRRKSDKRLKQARQASMMESRQAASQRETPGAQTS